MRPTFKHDGSTTLRLIMLTTFKVGHIQSLKNNTLKYFYAGLYNCATTFKLMHITSLHVFQTHVHVLNLMFVTFKQLLPIFLCDANDFKTHAHDFECCEYSKTQTQYFKTILRRTYFGAFIAYCAVWTLLIVEGRTVTYSC